VAELVGFSFAGAVTNNASSATTFGLTIPATSAVTGKFLIETTTAAENSSGDLFYRQSITDGLTATIAGYPVRASDYYVIVSDRTASGEKDFVSIRFSTTAAPPLPSTNFFVNSVNQAAGTFSIKIAADDENFLLSMALPSPAMLLDMTPGTSFLTSSSSSTGTRFSLGQLVQIVVPEPASFALMLGGLTAFMVCANGRVRRGR
jgi:hypothetical protein